MAGGGGGAKKLVINFLIDNPGKVYLGGAGFLYFYNKIQAQSTYNTYFGKFDFQRKLERNQLKH